MTREEIIKEAQEQLNYCTPLHTEDFIHGYLAGAEPREKQIEKMKNYLNCENYGNCGNSMGCPCDKWECIEK